MIFLCTGIEPLEAPLEQQGFHRVYSGSVVVDVVLDFSKQGYPCEAVVVSPHISDYTDLIEDIIKPLRMKGIRVIFLPGAPYGNDTREWIDKMVPWGVYDYVYDPIRPSDILNRINKPSTMEDIPNDAVEAANRKKIEVAVKEETPQPFKAGMLTRFFAKQKESKEEPEEDMLAAYINDPAIDMVETKPEQEEITEPRAHRTVEVERRKIDPGQAEELVARLNELEAQVNIEPLTGLYTRSFFKTWAERQIQDGIPLCVGFLDFDGFKTFNDQYGHPVGDQLLSAFGTFLKNATRETDVPTRWGGDEFLIALPMTPFSDATMVFERLQARWNDNPPKQLPATCDFSIGVLEYTPGMTLDELVSQVDKLMYEDKEKKAGRSIRIPTGPRDYTDTAIVGELDYEPSASNEPSAMFNGIKRSVVVATAANKGGVGKTTSSRSIAVTLANSGINTVIWDMDLGGANLSAFFQVSETGLVDYFDELKIKPSDIERLLTKQIKEEQLVDDTVIKEVISRAVVPVPGYNDLYLLARPNITKLPNLPVNAMTYLLSRIVLALRDNYRAVVVDTPQQPWKNRHLKGILANTDVVYWITDQSKESLDESGKYSASLFSLGVKPDRMRLVINKYDAKIHQIKPANIENVWKAKWEPRHREQGGIAGIIPVSHTDHINAGYKAKILNPEEWKQISDEVYCQLTGAHLEIKKKGIISSLFHRK